MNKSPVSKPAVEKATTIYSNQSPVATIFNRNVDFVALIPTDWKVKIVFASGHVEYLHIGDEAIAKELVETIKKGMQERE